MLIPSELLSINKRLTDIYGRTNNLTNYRLVWSEDLLEKRHVTTTTEGFLLPKSIVMEIPKYKQWIHEKYVLEQLTVVPEFEGNTLVEPLSYEPLWVFEDVKGRALDPSWAAIAFMITNVKEKIRSAGSHTKYKDPDDDPKEALENKEQRLSKMQEELFGNESDIADALHYKEGIIVPGSFTGTQNGPKNLV